VGKALSWIWRSAGGALDLGMWDVMTLNRIAGKVGGYGGLGLDRERSLNALVPRELLR
jgi:hypothetical protein